MGKTFANIHASMTGKFEGGVGEKIPQWIRANGGVFSRDVNPRVTHLITTEEAFKQNVDSVDNAHKLGIKVVTYDWLDDSLLSLTRRPKGEGPYLLKNIVKVAEKKAKKAHSAKAKASKTPIKVTKSQPKAPKRPAVDPFVKLKGKRKAVRQEYFESLTGTLYSATIFRRTKPPATTREKCQLAVYESLSEPHMYSTYIKFSRTGKSSVEVLAPPRKSIQLAIGIFKTHFKIHTGKDWEDRADGQSPPPKKDADGNSLLAHDGWFYLEEQRSILSSFMMGTQNMSRATNSQSGSSNTSAEQGK
ncbi:hypothetical protein PENANT_c023G04818 [Penicillium antarcticum]|uniref:Uncharacterized protein n=1 Tax=Penicillium antarcticum TaxID=416450 RepID=A0A1V6PZV6_9EURO|nr:uncharacterized protein N7508_006226 [Penicillium antarcticum]KAJ5301363.1 hypothetical protein N7508_006226 [Penicillium antarcticum]OQD82172.1 hypothetical protein PENANT_c023G04818 [Penicillium antarcticum]